jgi:predicted lipoprotein
MKLKLIIGLCLLGAVAAVAILGPKLSSDAQDSDFSRQAMLENIATNIILPTHQAFIDQTIAFQDAATTFESDPSLDTLEALQQSWRDSSSTWQKVSLFEMGRRTFVYHSEIDNHSAVHIDTIEDQILPGDDVLDADYLGGRGSSLKGLRTLEYLIFGPENDPDQIIATFTSLPYAERRMQYLVAAVNLLHENALDIWEIWSPDGENYVADFIEADDGSSIQESISMLSNLMLNDFEHVVQMNIGIGLGGNSGEVDPAYATAPYSGYSLEQAVSFLEILQQTFNGDGADGSGLGFDDYLNFLDAQSEDGPLSDAINAQIDVFREAVISLEDVDLLAEPDLIQPVYSEGIKLLSLMKVDMAAQMGITITFSDLDGD